MKRGLKEGGQRKPPNGMALGLLLTLLGRPKYGQGFSLRQRTHLLGQLREDFSFIYKALLNTDLDPKRRMHPHALRLRAQAQRPDVSHFPTCGLLMIT